MREKLTAIGDSMGVIIEKPSLELLGIDKDTELEIRTDGERLLIEPVGKSRRDRASKAIDSVLAKHAETMRKLAK
jgi:antitoxin component of MazEF toxin-antitoxin module